MLIAVLAMLLQGLLLGSGVPAHAAADGVDAGAAPICAPAPGGDHGLPACDHPRPHCCLSGASCDDPAAPGPASPEAGLWSRGVAMTATPRLALSLRRPPAGWASSWSAQAPPSVS